MGTKRVAIIDSGGANIASVLFALDRLAQPATLTVDRDTILRASHVILPGVGAARTAMARLRKHGLIDVIRGLTQPVLGICLGLQLLADASEEDDVECLGIVPGTVSRLSGSTERPVPNMGWCPISVREPHAILDGITNGVYFYFLHSYALPVSGYTLATADHEEPFSAVIRQRNFVAAQYHPERSSHAGARLLRNFLELPT